MIELFAARGDLPPEQPRLPGWLQCLVIVDGNVKDRAGVEEDCGDDSGVDDNDDDDNKDDNGYADQVDDHDDDDDIYIMMQCLFVCL